MSAQPLRKDTDTPNENEGQGVINIEFTTKQSLPARVERQRFQKKPVAANDNDEREEPRDTTVRDRMNTERNLQKLVRKRATEKATATTVKKTAAKGVGEIFLWIGGAISVFIFTFGFLGLILVFIGSTDLADALNKVVTVFTDPISLFGDEEVANGIVQSGMFILMFTLLVSFFSYLALGIVFAFFGLSLVSDTTLFVATTLCLALDMMPVTQLFPWMLVWIVVLEISLVTDT